MTEERNAAYFHFFLWECLLHISFDSKELKRHKTMNNFIRSCNPECATDRRGWKRHGCKRTKGTTGRGKGDDARCFLSHVMLSPCLPCIPNRSIPCPVNLRMPTSVNAKFILGRGCGTWIQSTNIGAGSIYMQKRNAPSSISGSTIHFVRNTGKAGAQRNGPFFFLARDHADGNKRERIVSRRSSF